MMKLPQPQAGSRKRISPSRSQSLLRALIFFWVVSRVSAAASSLAQLVEEERVEGLEDVLLGGVVLAEGAPGLGVPDGLEHGPEDGRADPGPVDGAGLEDRGPEVLVERGEVDALLEDAAVDVLEADEPGGHLRRFGGVEEGEEVVEDLGRGRSRRARSRAG